MRRRMEHAERGCTIVEPLIAMVVLTVSVLGMAEMFVIAQRGIAGASKNLEAAALAESRMERLRVVPYRLLLADGLDGMAVAEGTARLVSNGIALTWTVRPDRPLLAVSQSAQIFVTAEWSDGGRARTISFGMRRANPIFNGGVS